MNAKWIKQKLAAARHRWTPKVMLVTEFHMALNRVTERRIIPIIYKRLSEVNRRWWLESVRGGKFPEGMGNIK